MSGRDALASITRGRGPIERKDVLSNADYQVHRTEWLAEGRKAKSQRRVRLGESFSLLFENRLTVWLQIQEELRWVARPRSPQVTELLNRYNPLISEPDAVCASLFLDASDEAQLSLYTSGYTVARLNLRMNLHGALREAALIGDTEVRVDAVNYLRFRRTRQSFTDLERLYWCDPECREAPLPSHVSKALRDDLAQASFSIGPCEHAPASRLHL